MGTAVSEIQGLVNSYVPLKILRLENCPRICKFDHEICPQIVLVFVL